MSHHVDDISFRTKEQFEACENGTQCSDTEATQKVNELLKKFGPIEEVKIITTTLNGPESSVLLVCKNGDKIKITSNDISAPNWSRMSVSVDVNFEY